MLNGGILLECLLTLSLNFSSKIFLHLNTYQLPNSQCKDEKLSCPDPHMLIALLPKSFLLKSIVLYM